MGSAVELERLVTLIVRTVIEELVRQGMIQTGMVTEKKRGPEAAAPTAARAARCDRKVISARIVLDVAKAGHTRLVAPSGAIITPLALDMAREKGVVIEREGEKT
jgi:hypothetical protein